MANKQTIRIGDTHGCLFGVMEVFNVDEEDEDFFTSRIKLTFVSSFECNQPAAIVLNTVIKLIYSAPTRDQIAEFFRHKCTYFF